MSEQKQKKIKKGWIIALAAALILLCALFTVNAATDGAIFNGEMLQGLIVRFNGKETRLNDYEHTVELTTDADGEEVVKYSYDLPEDRKVDVYVAEAYTAFSVDNADSDSIQIFGKNADGSVAIANSYPSRITEDNVK